MGDLESWKGNYNEGLSHLEQALLAYEQDGNEIGVASVLRKQAVVYYRHSYHLKALQAAVGALEKCRNLNDRLGTAEALYVIGSSYAIQIKNGEAIPFLQEALEIFQTDGNDVGVVQCLERIGEIHRREWRYAEACSNLERAVEIARRCGDKLGEVKALLILGAINVGRGERTRAFSLLSETRDMARGIGWEHGLCTSLLHLSNIKSFYRQNREAEEFCRESIAVARRSNAGWRLAQALSALGRYLQNQGQIDEAEKVLEESCSVYQQVSLANSESASTASELATVKKEQGKTGEALFWYDQTITRYRSLGSMYDVSKYLDEMGNILIDAKRYDEGALHLEACLVVRMEHGYSYGWTCSKLSRIPRTAMTWEGRKRRKPVLSTSSSVSPTSPLLCDVKKIQRRIPQIATANLKLPIRGHDPPRA